MYVENIEDQVKALSELNITLELNDSIKVDTTFGWHDGNEWLTFPLKGAFKILKIFPEEETSEVRLLIKAVVLEYEKP